MDDITALRTFDPQRGAFCAVRKDGTPIYGTPPTTRNPFVHRETNPRGVRHVGKTYMDSQPVKERQRYKDWLKRQEAMR